MKRLVLLVVVMFLTSLVSFSAIKHDRHRKMHKQEMKCDNPKMKCDNSKEMNHKDFRGKDFRGKDFRGKDFRGKDFRGKHNFKGDFKGKELSYIHHSILLPEVTVVANKI